MKLLILILFPFCLEAQLYRLDSIKGNAEEINWVEKFTYEDPRNFNVVYESYYLNELEYIISSQYEDSLLVEQTSIQYGDTFSNYYEYDNLRRLKRYSTYRHDSLNHELKYSYHLNTDLILNKQNISYKSGDTLFNGIETFEYDNSLRIVYNTFRLLKSDTIFRSGGAYIDYVNDSLSYLTQFSFQQPDMFDTTYHKNIVLPDVYFGDTLRTWSKYFIISRDSTTLTNDERVTYQWGDFSKYENAGDWTYFHGILYGNYIEYTQALDTLFFIAYASTLPNGNPANWRIDIEKYGRKSVDGYIKLNEGNLPLEQIYYDRHGFINQKVNWYYSELDNLDDPQAHSDTESVCKMINSLNVNSEYYDLNGRGVQHCTAPQYLIEVSGGKANRVLFIK